MTIILTALALAGAQAPGQAAPAPNAHAAHAQHKQGQQKMDDCCCKDMAKGGKMACCEGHEGAHGEGHSGHPASR